MLQHQLQRVRERIQQACQRCHRAPSSVTLVGVTKGVSSERIREAVALGLTDVGENRVQETRDKQVMLESMAVRWHLIGHLQRNKAKLTVELFDVIHSIDSLPLIDELGRHATARNVHLEVFVQVNIAGEATKFGCRPQEAVALAITIARSRALRLIGLMTIAPYVEDPEAARPHFQALRMLRDDVQRQLAREVSEGAQIPLKLSMGMSGDFEVAIEEGADIVRIGTAIFGTRDKRQET